MKKFLQWTALAVLAAGSAQAADIRLGLNTSATLGCEVAGLRAGLQEGRFGGYLQGSYCTSNVAGQSGGPAFGGGLTFDFYQSPTINAYGLVGASTTPNSNANIYGGVGARYALPLLPVEAYVEGGVSRTSTVIGGLIGPRFVLGINYVWRGVDLSQASTAAGSSSVAGNEGTATESSGGTIAAAPAECNVSPEADAAAAESVARSAAQKALASAAAAYSALYSNVSYEVSIGGANINGNRATVSGTITLNATNRTTGEPVSGSYGGVVTLSRSGCSWVATGYRQNGKE